MLEIPHNITTKVKKFKVKKTLKLEKTNDDKTFSFSRFKNDSVLNKIITLKPTGQINVLKFISILSLNEIL